MDNGRSSPPRTATRRDLAGLAVAGAALAALGKVRREADPGTESVRSEYGLNVRDFGALADGQADDTHAILRACDRAQLTGETVYLPAGTYQTSAPIAWDSSAYSIIGEASVIDATSLSEGAAIRVRGRGTKGTGFQHTGYLHTMSGLELVGPRRDSGGPDGIVFEDVSGLDGAVVSHCAVDGFRNSLSFGNNNWCISFRHCTFGHFMSRGASIVPGNNAGENYSFDHCTWFSAANSQGSATAIYTDGNPDVSLTACSLDYNDIEIDHNGGTLSLLGCHIEDGRQATFRGGPMVRLTAHDGVRTVLTMSGGIVSPTEAPEQARSSVLEISKDSSDGVSATFIGVNFETFDLSTSIISNFATGAPLVRHVGGDINTGGRGRHMATMGQYTSLLINGDFSQPLSGVSGWISTGDAEVVFGRVREGETRTCARITAQGASRRVALAQLVPVAPMTPIVIQGWLDASELSNASESLVVAFAWSLSGAPRQSAQFNLTPLPTASRSDWQPFSRRAVVPAGTDRLSISVQARLQPSHSAWLRDLVVTQL